MPVPVQSFMENVLADEGWVAPLSSESAEQVILKLEDALPEGTVLDDARAARIRQDLRTLADLVSALKAGRLTETQLVDAWIGPLVR